MKSPPFLVSFQSAEDYSAALDSASNEIYWGALDALIKQNLPPVASVRALACLFGLSGKFVGALRRKPESHYRTFTIQKGNKRRVIHAPRVGLKVIQKWFANHLAKAVAFEDAVFGFVPGRSAPEGAAKHSRADWVLSMDLADFFPSVPRMKVEAALVDLGYTPHGAAIAAALCCFGEGLAQGCPASPVLSNLVFRAQDVALSAIAEQQAIRYTRYADDIVFSGFGKPPDGLELGVRQVLTQAGWKLNEKKVKLVSAPRRLKVHGLLVHGRAPRLTKGYRNRIRAIRHLLAAGKIGADNVRKAKGHLAYADSIEEMAGSLE